MLLAGVWRSAQKRPNDLALLTGDGQRLTWARLVTTVDSFAACLIAAGLRPGQRVAAWVDNPGVQICLWMAALRVSAEPVLASPGAVAGAGQMVDLAVTLPEGGGPARGRLIFGAHWSPDRLRDPPVLPPMPEAEAGLIVASSGSTGQAKLMPYLPETAAARHRLALAMLGPPGGPVALCLNPASAAGWRYVYFALAEGQALVLPASDPATTLDRMARAGARFLCAVPGQLAALCRAAEAGRQRPGLTRVLTVGAMCPPGLAESVNRAFGVALTVAYGTTECSTMAQGDLGQDDAEPGRIGPTSPGVEVAVDPVTGRLKVRVPPAVRVGDYLNAEGPFDDDGWFLTGDCGHLDAQGHLHLRGRADAAIAMGTLTVLPEDLERAVLRLPGVREAVAFGVPRGDGWEMPWLALVADGALSRRALARALLDAASGLPDVQVLRLPTLPLTPTGKADRQALRKLALDDQAAATPLPLQKP